VSQGTTRDHASSGALQLPSALAQVLGRWVYASDRAIVVGNRAGIVEWANQAWTRITGRSRAETVAKPVADFLIEADIDVDLVDFVQASFARGARCEVELPFTTPDGKRSWFHLTVDPVRNVLGEVGEFVAVAEDISARKQRELAQGQKPPARREILPTPSSGELLAGCAMEHVDLTELCEARMHLLAADLQPHTHLDLVLQRNLPRVLVDRVQVGQALTHLLRSGARAMGSDWGTLSVTTQLIDSEGGQAIPSETFPGRFVAHGLGRFPYAAVEIHDTGPSLPLPARASQADRATTSRPDATGNGSQTTATSWADERRADERSAMLSVARTILRVHDGELLVDSAPGCGTRVLVLLPV
jgi:PAS domain S-box-containing protein